MEAARTRPADYQRRDPAGTLLWQTVAASADEFIEERRMHGAGLPPHIETELRDFLRCGVIQHGFVRFVCEACGHERAIPFSCKRRGVCPSCTAKRMSELAIHLIENLLPLAPYRQWIVTMPHSLRYAVAANRQLLGRVHRLIASSIQQFYVSRAAELGVENAHSGFVSFLHMCGSALQLNPHWHFLFVDGVFARHGGEDGPVVFTGTSPLSNDDLASVLGIATSRVISHLQSIGWLDEPTIEPAGRMDPLFNEHPDLGTMAEASIGLRVAFGERAGLPVRRLGRGFGFVEEIPLATGRLICAANGFTAHAARRVASHRRDELEDLICYMGRPPVAESRLSRLPNGNLAYRLRRPWSDGSMSLEFSERELLEKLVSMIPAPRLNLIRYGGVFAPNHRLRAEVVLKPHVRKGFVETGLDDSGRSVTSLVDWARVYSRVFAIDVSVCPRCEGRMRILAAVVDPSEVARYLRHVGIDPQPPSVARTRWRQGELDYGARDPPSTDDVPVINS